MATALYSPLEIIWPELGHYLIPLCTSPGHYRLFSSLGIKLNETEVITEVAGSETFR